MDERTSGVILRTRPLTETSLIVQWLTRDAGRISTVAKGARREKSVFRGKLDLFYVADLSFRRSRRSDLHTLAEVMVRETHPMLRTDWRRLNQAAYGVALIEQTTETDTPMAETHALFTGYLERVNGQRSTVLNVLALELKHLGELGILPDFERESLPVGSRKLAEELSETEWACLGELEAPPEALRPLLRFLHGFLIFHLGRLPRGRAEALEAGGPTG